MSSRIEARAPSPATPPPIETAASVVASFLSDAAHVAGGFAEGVTFPSTESEIAAVLSARSRILPIGAQSSLTGGATPRGETILGTRRLTTFERVDAHHVRVGAGMPIAVLQQTLAATGLYYPPAPTYDGAFVGGTIATNAAGAATFKYGSTRSWVQALTVVLANGDLLDVTRGRVAASPSGTFEIALSGGKLIVVPIPSYLMPAVPKLSAGYHAAPGMDLADLFIGSEGTLGVITSAVLRVIPTPARAVALITCDDEHQALAVTSALREQARLAWVGRSPLDVSAIEYMDSRSLRAVPDAAFDKAAVQRPSDAAAMLLVQLEVGGREREALAVLGDLLEDDGVSGDPLCATAGDERGAQRLFELREAVPASVNTMIAAAKQREDAAIEKTAGDFIVPFGRLEGALSMFRRAFADRGIDVAIWGHVSDGNMHVNVIPRAMQDVVDGREVLIELARDVIRMGGSPLAEHGVGRSAMKQRLLRELYGDDGIEQMRAVKRALDPAWKLSPGVLLPAAGEQ